MNLFSMAAPKIFRELEEKTGEALQTIKITAHRPDNVFSLNGVTSTNKNILIDKGELNKKENKTFIEAIEAQIKISVREVKEVAAVFMDITRQEKKYTCTMEVYYIDINNNKLKNTITL